ncbi:MAG: hypothetical protein JNM94_00835 [Phycisphaerae bacterium]|nr:hypothetical protein [Phycisphaerae bacterium]
MTEIVDPTACFRCGYSLHGTPDGGSCPECGLTKRESDRAFAAVRAGVDRTQLRIARYGLTLAFGAWTIVVPMALWIRVPPSSTIIALAFLALLAHLFGFFSVGRPLQRLHARSGNGELLQAWLDRTWGFLRFPLMSGALWLMTKYGVPVPLLVAAAAAYRLHVFANVRRRLRPILDAISAAVTGADETRWKLVWASTAIAWAILVGILVAYPPRVGPRWPLAVASVLVGVVDGAAQFLSIRLLWRADRLLENTTLGDILRTARKRIPYDSSANP